ncbi:ATP cone domain-containing protein [Terriglobus sp. YAF25]|uniref:ATP cone domain-containing protein n=1 Tax=Terriglobus sp. YAF25 TaxID=3233080 RepID=UPI003F96C916
MATLSNHPISQATLHDMHPGFPAPASETAVMHVRKRNGSLEPVDVNKIVRAVQRCAQGLNSSATVSSTSACALYMTAISCAIQSRAASSKHRNTSSCASPAALPAHRRRRLSSIA